MKEKLFLNDLRQLFGSRRKIFNAVESVQSGLVGRVNVILSIKVSQRMAFFWMGG